MGNFPLPSTITNYPDIINNRTNADNWMNKITTGDVGSDTLHKADSDFFTEYNNYYNKYKRYMKDSDTPSNRLTTRRGTVVSGVARKIN